MNYVQHACFTDADVLYLNDGISTDDQGLTVITDQQGECSVAIDCEPVDFLTRTCWKLGDNIHRIVLHRRFFSHGQFVQVSAEG